jgi:hypothetical protein
VAAVAYVFRKIGIATLAGALVLAAAKAGLAQRYDGQVVRYHGVDFPAEFAEGRRLSTRDYEATNPGLGFSAGYRHRNATSTLYVYDLGLKSIPDDISSAVVVRQFEQARSDIATAQAGAAVLSSRGQFTIADSRRRPRLRCEGLNLKRGDQPPIATYLCLGAINGKFFKVRTTALQAEGSQEELRRFIDAWVVKLWP